MLPMICQASSADIPPAPAAAITQAVAAATLLQSFCVSARRCKHVVTVFPELSLLMTLKMRHFNHHHHDYCHHQHHHQQHHHQQQQQQQQQQHLLSSATHAINHPSSTSTPALKPSTTRPTSLLLSFTPISQHASFTKASAFSFVPMPRTDTIFACFSKRRARRSIADGL